MKKVDDFCETREDVKNHLMALGQEKIRSCPVPEDLVSCFPDSLRLHLDLCLGCRVGVLIVGMLVVSTGENVRWLDEEPPHE